MQIPKKITPDPIFSALLEIRFESNFTTETVLGEIFPLFHNKYPNLKNRSGNVPAEIRNNFREFEYFADYMMNNESFSILFGKNVFALEIISEYCGWESFFEVIKREFELLSSTNKIQKITRIGLRYRNLFENESNAQKILKFQLKLDDSLGYSEQKVISFVSEVKFENINLLMQIAGEAQTSKISTPNSVYRGVYIDIDVFSNNNIPNKIDNSFYQFVEKLHYHEKLLFFQTLNEDYLKTLNPEY